jgi:hypothetical protein
VKRKPFFHLVTALFLALGWLGFQTWQSIHRYHDHYLHGEAEEHGSCQMCDWEVPLIELSESLELLFVGLSFPKICSSAVVLSLIDSFVSIPQGRGPPGLMF